MLRIALSIAFLLSCIASAANNVPFSLQIDTKDGFAHGCPISPTHMLTAYHVAMHLNEANGDKPIPLHGEWIITRVMRKRSGRQMHTT